MSYRLQLVLRDSKGALLVAEDVDCNRLTDAIVEFGGSRDGITSRRFLDKIEDAFLLGVESLAPPILRGEPLNLGKPDGATP